jgi:hypothetical protein
MNKTESSPSFRFFDRTAQPQRNASSKLVVVEVHFQVSCELFTRMWYWHNKIDDKLSFIFLIRNRS